MLKQLIPWRFAGRAGRPLADLMGRAGITWAVKKGVNLGKQLMKASGRSVGGWLHPRLRVRTEDKLLALPLESAPGEILVFLLETQACLSKEKELK